MSPLMATVAVSGLSRFSLSPAPSLTFMGIMGLKRRTKMLISKPWKPKVFLQEPRLGILSDLPFPDLFPKLTPPALHP